MSERALSLEKAASTLKLSKEQVIKACNDHLNKSNAVMLSREEVEKLQLYIKESPWQTSSRRQGGTAKRSHVPTKAKSRMGTGVKVMSRTRRGKDQIGNRLNKPATEPEITASAPPEQKAVPILPGASQYDAKKVQDNLVQHLDLIYVKQTSKPKEVVAIPEVAEPATPVVIEKPVIKPKSHGPVPTGTISISVEQAKRRAKSARKHRSKTSLSGAIRKQAFHKPVNPRMLTIDIPVEISIKELSYQMSVKSVDVLEKLSQLMEFDLETPPEMVDQDTACLLVEEFGHKADRSISKQADFINKKLAVAGNEIVARPPVVTVMGHVDHGKTSLLDYIRKSKVTASEDGGITQHIGAYQVETDNGKITFIDTPGHKVFTEMRARGAQVTDIVILVVAADDGVQPQTREAIAHAKAAEVPIIVAINKMDLEHADPDKIINELASLGVLVEEIGGDTVAVRLSALTGEGIDKLLENLLLLAELLELRAPIDVDARGTIIEAHTEKGLGTIVSLIVKDGILRKGDFLLCETEYGRVRAMRDEHGNQIKEAYPTTPVQLQGLSQLPRVGSEFIVAKEEQSARAYAAEKRNLFRQRELAYKRPVNEANSLEELFAQADKQEEDKVLNLLVKTDVAGTCEAMGKALAELGNDDVKLKIIHIGVGAISESDVALAHASNAVLVGFRVVANPKARSMIRSRNLDAFYSNVFYEVTDNLKARLLGMLEPTLEEQLRGTAQVKEIFYINKIGKIAGCVVNEGTINVKLPIRVVRDGKIVCKTEISELRHYKNKTNTVSAGSDCGICLQRFSDFKPGDFLETYEVAVIAKTL